MFAIQLDPVTMTYSRDDSIDLEAWKEAIGAHSGTIASNIAVATVVGIVEKAGLKGIEKASIARALIIASRAASYRLIAKAEDKKAIMRRKDDDLYVVPQSRKRALSSQFVSPEQR